MASESPQRPAGATLAPSTPPRQPRPSLDSPLQRFTAFASPARNAFGQPDALNSDFSLDQHLPEAFANQTNNAIKTTRKIPQSIGSKGSKTIKQSLTAINNRMVELLQTLNPECSERISYSGSSSDSDDGGVELANIGNGSQPCDEQQSNAQALTPKEKLFILNELSMLNVIAQMLIGATKYNSRGTGSSLRELKEILAASNIPNNTSELFANLITFVCHEKIRKTHLDPDSLAFNMTNDLVRSKDPITELDATDERLAQTDPRDNENTKFTQNITSIINTALNLQAINDIIPQQLFQAQTDQEKNNAKRLIKDDLKDFISGHSTTYNLHDITSSVLSTYQKCKHDYNDIDKYFANEITNTIMHHIDSPYYIDDGIINNIKNCIKQTIKIYIDENSPPYLITDIAMSISQKICKVEPTGADQNHDEQHLLYCIITDIFTEHNFGIALAVRANQTSETVDQTSWGNADVTREITTEIVQPHAEDYYDKIMENNHRYLLEELQQQVQNEPPTPAI